jgi:hypothetical protein
MNEWISVGGECLLNIHQPSTETTQYQLVLNADLTHNTTTLHRNTPNTNQETIEHRKHALSVKGKDIHVTGYGGPQGCETSRLPHFLDNQFTDVSEFFSLTLWPPFTPRKISGIHFCYRLSRPQGHCASGRYRSIAQSSYLIGNGNSDLPACSVVPQPTTLPLPPPPKLIISWKIETF